MESLFKELFTGSSQEYNPLNGSNKYLNIIYDYKSFGNKEALKEVYNLTDKQLQVILAINRRMPELYLAPLVNIDLIKFDIPNHTMFENTYSLEYGVYIPENDYQSIERFINSDMHNQISFSSFLYAVTKALQEKSSQYKVNYNLLTLLLTKSIFKIYNQTYIESVLPDVYYHIYVTNSGIIEITRLYNKNLKVYQQFEFKCL